MEIGKTIKMLRKQNGYTQQELADLLNVTDKAVSKWERDLSLPDISILPNLAFVLNCDLDEILEGNISYSNEDWQGLLIIKDDELEIHPNITLFTKPLVYLPLSYYMLVGIRNIYVLCSKRTRLLLKDYIADVIDKYEINISFISSVNEMKVMNTMRVEGFPFVYGLNLTKYLQHAMIITKRNRITTLLGVGGINNAKFMTYNKQNKLIRLSTKGSMTPVGITFFSSDNVSLLEKDKEYLIKMKLLYAEPINRGMISYPIVTHDNAYFTNNMIYTIKNTMGIDIYNIDEIASNRGMIRKKKV